MPKRTLKQKKMLLHQKINETLHRLIRHKRGRNLQKFSRMRFDLAECACKLTDVDRKNLLYALGTRDAHALREQLCDFFADEDPAQRQKVLYDIVHADARKAIQCVRENYMRSRTNAPPTHTCPECNQPSLTIRVFAGAAAGSAGGKAVQRSKSHCSRCGYSDEA